MVNNKKQIKQSNFLGYLEALELLYKYRDSEDRMELRDTRTNELLAKVSDFEVRRPREPSGELSVILNHDFWRFWMNKERCRGNHKEFFKENSSYSDLFIGPYLEQPF